ncbi:MAG: hypothetical protein HC906_14935 [Bacteroidales bacterium]|nr:hypothetical protein [Bacteroidales bacterium]
MQIIAFTVATPAGWFFVNKWLENFSYKTELSWWIFPIAGLISLSLMLLTVVFQSWRSANMNPVEALKYE